MTFFNEQNNDEIWEELKYWLKNPITEKEQIARDKEINDYVNYVINRMYKD